MKIDWEKIAPIAGQLADYTTTRYALGRPGMAEGNPMMRNLAGKPSVFLAVKLGAGLGMALAVQALQSKGHRTAARVVGIVGTLFGAGPAISNSVMAR